MAVYQGARQRSGFAFPVILRPRPEPAAPALRRAHSRRTTGGRVGIRRPATPRVGLVLAGIVVTFSGAFLWLTQSVNVAATNYDIVRLVSERDRLEALNLDLRSDIERLSGAPAVRQQAIDLGLGQLGAPLVIPAR